jgi:hypothetical protein
LGHWINEMLSSELLHIHTLVHVIIRACVHLYEICGRSGECVQLKNVFAWKTCVTQEKFMSCLCNT